jgi:L,D-peptidoglycan transpeptidase YkuD (ErfK/YbiS/YcfS/YnhG family)
VTYWKHLELISPTQLRVGEQTVSCTIGNAGVRADKREGDGATPAGTFALRACYYRPDRITPPETGLKLIALSPDDGWCDDPAHPLYNTPVKLPFAARHENLWREDHCYDLIIPLGYNDDPVVVGKGSAIFLHVMHDDGRATEGCIALKLEDLLALLPRLAATTTLVIPDLDASKHIVFGNAS